MPRSKIRSEGPMPAHATKDQENLVYPFLNHKFNLKQLANGVSNGTGLWLGGQCLSLYLAQNKLSIQKEALSTRPKTDLGEKDVKLRCIELGSGIGLAALAVASLGWDVLATDTPYIVEAVLKPNILHNLPGPTPTPKFGSVEVRDLDWTTQVSSWNWSDPAAIASTQFECMHNSQARASEPFLEQPQAKYQLQPPFDLIISSDTVYDPELSKHLLKAMYALSLAGRAANAGYPPIYLAIENRDPVALAGTLQEARSEWHFQVERIPHAKVISALKRGGVCWDDEEWEGIEIWRLTLMVNAMRPT